MFIGRTDVEAETPILWPPDVKSWLIGKDPDAGKDWGQEEKGTTEDEIVGWHCRLNGHGFGWTLGVSDGQGGLVCCGSWGRKELDMTERLNWTKLSMRQVVRLGQKESNAWRLFFGGGCEEVAVVSQDESYPPCCCQEAWASFGKSGCGSSTWGLILLATSQLILSWPLNLDLQLLPPKQGRELRIHGPHVLWNTLTPYTVWTESSFLFIWNHICISIHFRLQPKAHLSNLQIFKWPQTF